MLGDGGETPSRYIHRHASTLTHFQFVPFQIQFQNRNLESYNATSRMRSSFYRIISLHDLAVLTILHRITWFIIVKVRIVEHGEEALELDR